MNGRATEIYSRKSYISSQSSTKKLCRTIKKVNVSGFGSDSNSGSQWTRFSVFSVFSQVPFHHPIFNDFPVFKAFSTLTCKVV